MLRATGAKLFGHPDEKPLRANVVGICSMFGISARGFENSPEPDTYLRGGETVSLGGHSFKVIFTPGHSTGHLAYYNEAEKVLLGGDVLFKGSIGRTDLPGGDFKTLIKSIRHLVETLPPDTRVLSGHGPDTTLGDELRTNPFLEELRGDG
jgi:glyoxylase-like metal-dependent hydrolase (beta-lactamase superfamily II)